MKKKTNRHIKRGNEGILISDNRNTMKQIRKSMYSKYLENYFSLHTMSETNTQQNLIKNFKSAISKKELIVI